MKRLIVTLLSFVFAVGALAPASSAAETKPKFQGEGSARALDLSIPLLKALPALGQNVSENLGENFKGLTLGLTSTQFSSDPMAKGMASASCELLPTGVSLPKLPADLPCSKESVETSSAPEGNGGDGVDSCATVLKVSIVDLAAACANSLSKIENQRPVSLNKGGVADVNLTVTDLSKLLGLGVEDTKNQLTNTVSGLVSQVMGTVQGVAPVAPAQLQQAVGNVLNQIRDLNVSKLAAIKAGTASSEVTGQGAIETLTSQAAGAKIGLLGIGNPLEDGLVIIDVTAAKATATWDDATGTAKASATPALATIKVRDLLDVVPGSDYLSATVDAGLLNNLLAPLSGTILDSSIDLATATPSQEGRSAAASTSGVGLHLLKGVGESAPGARDGGLILRIASADAKIAGDVATATPIESAPTLPRTGGQTYVFLAGAALLAIAAPLFARLSRRIGRITT